MLENNQLNIEGCQLKTLKSDTYMPKLNNSGPLENLFAKVETYVYICFVFSILLLCIFDIIAVFVMYYGADLEWGVVE